MADKELKQLEKETVIVLKHNIEKMCQADNLLEVFLRAKVINIHTVNLRDCIVSRKFKPDHYIGKTGECFMDEILKKGKWYTL